LSVKFAVHAVFTILFGVISSGYIYSRGEDVLNWWYEMYILSGVITGFYSVIQFFVFISFPSVGELWVGGIPRAYALTTEPSYLAFFLVPIFFVAFSNYRYKAAIIIAAGILFSTSRTGLVGLVGGGAALAFIRPREFGQLAWQAIKYAGGVVLLFLVVPAIQEGIVRFFQFVWKGFTDLDVGSAYVRLLSWFYALELFLEHPIFGVGVQGYGPAMHAKGLMLNRDAEEVRTTMLYLEILAEYGIVGFLVFVWWLTSPLFVLWRHRMDERAAGLLTALSSMLLMFPFIQNWWRPYLWIAWVLAYVLAARYQSDQV
jgi:O-antigen ligase